MVWKSRSIASLTPGCRTCDRQDQEDGRSTSGSTCLGCVLQTSPAAGCIPKLSTAQHNAQQTLVPMLTLTATTSPGSQHASAAPFSDSCALCTWPMLPHAMGTSSIQSNSWSGGRSNDLCSAWHVYLLTGFNNKGAKKLGVSRVDATAVEAVQASVPTQLLLCNDQPRPAPAKHHTHLKLCAGACVCSFSSASHTSCANRSWRVAAHCRDRKCVVQRRKVSALAHALTCVSALSSLLGTGLRL